mmetsp:Transcript_4854/g.10717  ORF Transcript_4854/g.10717 Transcript_4854/m.10717 type:complete len:266 (+) Transcript_4854:118-915(+)
MQRLFTVTILAVFAGSAFAEVSSPQQTARAKLVAEAHSADKEVEAAWAEVEKASSMQHNLVDKLTKQADSLRKAGNTKAAQATEKSIEKLKGLQGALETHLGSMRTLLTKTKPFLPDNLLQKGKRGSKAVAFLQAMRAVREAHRAAPEDQLAQEMTHDLEMNFNKIAPFGKEDTAKELQDHAAKTQDTLVDAVENAEVAEIKRAVFRALTRLRAATIKEFDTIARLETQAIDAYNDAHHYRAENPLAHLHEDEAPVETDKLKSFH